MYIQHQFDKTLSSLGSEELGLHEAVHKCIQQCDIDLRSHMYSNIICSGGNTMLYGKIIGILNSVRTINVDLRPVWFSFNLSYGEVQFLSVCCLCVLGYYLISKPELHYRMLIANVYPYAFFYRICLIHVLMVHTISLTPCIYEICIRMHMHINM